MKHRILVSIILLVFSTLSIAVPISDNIFSKPSELPLQAPPFDKIKDADYLPAFIEGMQQHLAEIQTITNNPEQPTFENTIIALEKSGQMLDRVSSTFNVMAEANTNETLRQIESEMEPKLAAHQDALFLNQKLFARIKTLHDNADHLGLDKESTRLLEIYYLNFVHAGANLNENEKLKLSQLNKQLAELKTTYQQKLLAANNKAQLVITDRTELSGLTEEEIAALAVSEGNQTKYIIPLENTTQQPLLTSLRNRVVREKLFTLGWLRTEQNDENDTRNIILKIARLRAEKAALLGYKHYVAFALYDQMVKCADDVHQFLNQLTPRTAAKLSYDANQIQLLIHKTNNFDLKPYDWDYYSEQIRKSKYDIDANDLKPYFELDRVLKDGVFYTANRLYGITFNERHDLPVYHPDVRVFDVIDKDGTQLGFFYVDYFKRPNKAGGAWMSTFREQSKLLGSKPIVYNIGNFTKPAPGMPALLTYDNVVTMFHEFGHALHYLFADVNYPTLSGGTSRDFVEFPSQFNEHWALYPEVLKNYAVNYKTGEPIPDSLVNKIKNASKFNQAYNLGETLAAAELDMKWHELSVESSINDVNRFEIDALKNTHTDFPNVPPRYRSSYFMHIWSFGYASGYYAYLWTQMLDNDAFAWFTEHGGLTRENGQRFRDIILSRGSSEDYATMFYQFYGKKPDIEPMLENLGI